MPMRLSSTSGQPVVTEKIQKRGNDEVRSIQSALNNLGSDPGPADGIMGPKIREAIKLYQ